MVEVPLGTDLDHWEVAEEGNPAREWAIPADVVNAWPRYLSDGPTVDESPLRAVDGP